MTAENLGTFTGYQFRRKELLEQALTHRSFSRNLNNERLEFLGDSILNLVISNHIYLQFDGASEGDLSRIRASLVKQETLAEVARGIGLGDHIRLGGGELKSGGFRRDSILADALEAILGGIVMDSGFEACRNSIQRLFADRVSQLSAGDELKDPKTRLQEYLQSRKLELPDYEVMEMTGHAHNQQFIVECRVKGVQQPVGGKGSSRRQAEQAAAESMLAQLEAGSGNE